MEQWKDTHKNAPFISCNNLFVTFVPDVEHCLRRTLAKDILQEQNSILSINTIVGLVFSLVLTEKNATFKVHGPPTELPQRLVCGITRTANRTFLPDFY